MPNLSSSLLSQVVESSSFAISISETAPAIASEGDLWYESDTGRIYIYYDEYWSELGAISNGEVNSTNMDGGHANSVYGGILAITGGSA
jgi:hypothetical protein